LPASISAEWGADVVIATAPTMSGYTFSGWSTNAGVVIKPTSLLSFFFGGEKFEMIDAPVTFNGEWIKGAGIHYKVEHYQQDVQDTTKYTKVDTDDLKGTTDEDATIAVRDFVGFEHRVDKTTWEAKDKVASTTKLTVADDGSLVIKVYYDRKIYEMNFAYIGEVPNDAPALPAKEKINFDGSVSVTPPAMSGYTFKGWLSTDVTVLNGQFNMPAWDVLLVGEWIKDGVSPGDDSGGSNSSEDNSGNSGSGDSNANGGGSGDSNANGSNNSSGSSNSSLDGNSSSNSNPGGSNSTRIITSGNSRPTIYRTAGYAISSSARRLIGGVKTGDPTSIITLVGMLVGAGLVIVKLIIKGRRMKRAR